MIKYYENKLIFKKSAKIVKQEIENILSIKDVVIIGLCGGRSINSILNELRKEELPWDKIHIFLVDERMVSIEDEQSNFKLIKDSLTNILPNQNYHPFIYNKKNCLKSYENELKKYNEKYDIVILSAGEDGHIASLYPNHHSINNESEFFIKMNDSPKHPKDRISISKKFLLKSEVAFLFFIGNAKSNALQIFLDEKIKYNNCPAKLVKKINKSYVFTDIKFDD